MRLKHLSLISSFVFCASLAALAQAETTPTPTPAPAPKALQPPPPDAQNKYLSYEEAVNIALHDNVDLLALREQESALKNQAKQALGPNEPVFTYEHQDGLAFSYAQVPAEVTYQVNWTLGFPGKSLSQSAATRHMAEAASEQALNQEITIMTTLSNTYVSFVTNDVFYKFLLGEQKRNKDLMKLLEKKFSASQAAKVDLLNAKVVTEQIAQSILQNRNDFNLLVTQFRQIIKRPTDFSLLPKIPEQIVIPEVTKSFDELANIMLRNNHTVAQAARQLDSAKASLNTSRLQALPDIQITAAIDDWLPYGAPLAGVTQTYTIGVGIAIPIFFAFNELQSVHAAEHIRGAAEYQLTSQQLQAFNGLQTAYMSLKATLKDLEASEKLVVPAAKASYDLTLLTYGLGKADYFALNLSRKAWNDSVRDMITKRQTAATLYNQLIAQLGCDISRTEGPNVCK